MIDYCLSRLSSSEGDLNSEKWFWVDRSKTWREKDRLYLLEKCWKLEEGGNFNQETTNKSHSCEDLTVWEKSRFLLAQTQLS